MHEYSIVQALIERATAEARKRGARAIFRLEVRVGAQSGVEVELLAKAYDVFRERTACERAELAITTVPARWTCPSCGRDIEPGRALRCVACATPAEMAQGDEIMLDRIEMEVSDV